MLILRLIENFQNLTKSLFRKSNVENKEIDKSWISTNIDNYTFSNFLHIASVVVRKSKRESWLVLKNGARYDGDVKNGLPNGNGIIVFPSGRVYIGEFVNGNMQGKGMHKGLHDEVHRGEYCGGRFNGEGEMRYVNGKRYQGNFKNGQRHGYGILVFKDGRIFEGDFDRGRISGHGILTTPSGRAYEGSFKDGKLHGKGRLVFASGTNYEGDFSFGKYNGQGVLTYSNGRVLTGKFINGKFQKNSYENGVALSKDEKKSTYKVIVSDGKGAFVDNEATDISNDNLTPSGKLKHKNTIFVGYEVHYDSDKMSYPILLFPQKNCIVRSHRYGKAKRRGYKEESFQVSIEKYFSVYFEIAGDIRLNTGRDTRPYEPDIAIIENKRNSNIRIDIEIDEPYAGITRQPTHCKGEDVLRDAYFNDRGWVVIRFSEYQVHTQEMECLKLIALIINRIDSYYTIPEDLRSVLGVEPENLWDVIQAQKWEKIKYRENYLNHEFNEILENDVSLIQDFDEQEIAEEIHVKSSIIGVVDIYSGIGYNKTNIHPRDERISFYPKDHIYTIDHIPALSASTIISKFFPEFDAVRKAGELNPNHPLHGLPIDEIVMIWKQKGIEAASLGTHLHEQIEKYYLKQAYEKVEEFLLFEQFVEQNSSIVPFRSEWRIFDEKYGIAGTVDLVASNNGSFEMYDWKRSKNVVNHNGTIIDNNFEYGIGILSDISNSSYNRYCLQQSLYRYILENNYNVKIDNMFLVVLHPNYETYHKIPVQYMEDKVKLILSSL